MNALDTETTAPDTPDGPDARPGSDGAGGPATMPGGPAHLTGERADLQAELTAARYFLRRSVRELTDEQAAARPTVSELCLGGLIKHVAHGERQWADFALGGPEALLSGNKPWSEWTEADYAEYGKTFRMGPGETLAGVLAGYAETAARTDELLARLDLDRSYPLPEAPWFEPGGRWTVRRTVLHIVAETLQHAGHADILRESLDGAKNMG